MYMHIHGYLFMDIYFVFMDIYFVLILWVVVQYYFMYFFVFTTYNTQKPLIQHTFILLRKAAATKTKILFT